MENIFSRAKAVNWSRTFSSTNVVSGAVCAHVQDVSRAVTHALTPAGTSRKDDKKWSESHFSNDQCAP